MRYLLFALSLGLCLQANAQNRPSPPDDTPAAVAAKKITADFPSTRPLTMEYQQSFSRDYFSEFGGEDFEEGKIGGQRRYLVGLNLPIYYQPKFIVSTSLRYTFDEMEFDQLERVREIEGEGTNNVHGYNAYSGALNFTHITELFGKPAVFSGGLILDGGNAGIERLKGSALATITIKKTEQTNFSLGMIAIIDPTSQLPFAPIVRYSHQFKNSPWMLDLVLPSQLLVRRPIGTRGRLSIGSTFGGNGYYVNIERPDSAQDYEYSQLEINTGVIYEHKVTNGLILTARGGLSSFLSNRLTEKGEPNADFVYRNQQASTGYFALGVSYNPFDKR